MIPAIANWNDKSVSNLVGLLFGCVFKTPTELSQRGRGIGGDQNHSEEGGEGGGEGGVMSDDYYNVYHTNY